MSKATPLAPAPAPAPIDVSSPMEQFLEANFKKLVLACALIALGAVLYGVVSYTNRANAIAAGEAFSSAKTVEDCDLVISEYEGTLAAGNALLLKADLLWTQNKKDSSVAALRDFTTKHTDHPLLPETLLGLATKLESMKETDEAQPLFERIISEYPNSDVAALAQIRLGDLLWSTGKEEEAKAAYEAVPAKFINADSDFIEQSEGRLKWISAKLPTKEVDGPPKPKVETPAKPEAGAPKLKLDSTTLNPTLLPPSTPPMAAPPQIKLETSPLTPTVTPDAVAPAMPKLEVPAGIEAPKMESPVAPAPVAPAIPAPATATPATPAAPTPPPAKAP